MKSDVPGSFVAAGGASNMNHVLVGANDLKSCRLRIDNQHGPGLQSVNHSLTARNLGLGESGDVADEESHARGATD